MKTIPPETIKLEVNPDCATDDELLAIQTMFLELAKYCGHLLSAREARQLGAIARAQRNENAAEKIYHSLPEHVRW